MHLKTSWSPETLLLLSSPRKFQHAIFSSNLKCCLFQEKSPHLCKALQFAILNCREKFHVVGHKYAALLHQSFPTSSLLNACCYLAFPEFTGGLHCCSNTVGSKMLEK